MAKTIGFNIRLNVDGKEVVVQCKKGIDDLSRALGTIPGKAGAVQQAFMGFAAVTTTIQGMYSGLQQIAGVMTTYIQKANAATEAQVKLRTVMMQRMQATQQDIDAINELVKSQTALGVVGGTVQRSGLQQLATFASQRSTLETLLPAMNNLLVQQNGINSTSENAVGIANLMGKALMGNYSALKRVGITLTDAQVEIIKTGNEGERAAAVAEAITQNVGQMNAEMAKTDAGRMKQASNELGGLQVKLGRLFSQYQGSIMLMGQAGAAVTGIGSITSGLVAFVRATGLATVATKAFRAVQASFAAMGPLITATINGTTLSVTALRNAIRGAMMSLGLIGAAVAVGGAALNWLIDKLDLFSGSTDKAKDSLQSLTGSTRDFKAVSDSLKTVEEQKASRMKEVRAELDKNISRLKTFNGSQKEEKKIVEEMNRTYGSRLGYFSSVQSWYRALTVDSETYTRQMEREAEAAALSQEIAEHRQNIRAIQYDETGRARRYSTQRQRDESTVMVGNGLTTTVKGKEIAGSSDAEKARAAIDRERAAIRFLRNEMDKAYRSASNMQYAVRGVNPETAQTIRGGQENRSNQSNRANQTNSVKKGISYADQIKAEYEAAERERHIGEERLKDEAALDEALPVRLKAEWETKPDDALDDWDNLFKSTPIVDVNKELDNVQRSMEAVAAKKAEWQKEMEDTGSLLESIGSIGQSFSQLGQTIGGVGGNMISLLGQLATTAAETIGKLIALAAAEGSVNAFRLPWPASLAAWATVIAAITSATASIAGFAGMKFANGGLAYGPTVGMVGEYAGASQNPEVIAPLDKLRRLIEPRDTGGLSGRVVFRVKGRELEGVLERQRRFEGRT